MSFIPLHVKSHYSLGLGTVSIEELVSWAARYDVPALGLTDVENLHGQIRFHHACSAAGVQPITGVELRAGFDGHREFGSKRGRVILLARDQEGYANLCSIVSRRRTSPRAAHAEAIDPVRSLADATRGLFLLSDDIEVLERTQAQHDASPGDLGLLVVRPAPSDAAVRSIQRARLLGFRLVADIDAVMIDRADHGLHMLLPPSHRRSRDLRGAVPQTSSISISISTPSDCCSDGVGDSVLLYAGVSISSRR